MLKHKKFIFKAAVILSVTLLLCTIFARSIETLLLAQVSAVELQGGKLEAVNKYVSSFTSNSTQSSELLALDNWNITKVLAKTGDEVKMGDSLFEIDISSYQIQKKQLEASIQQQINIINASELSQGDLLVENQRLDALKLQLMQIKASYPTNGEIIAKANGIVQIYESNGVVNIGARLADITVTSEVSYINMMLPLADAELFFSQEKKIEAEFLMLKSNAFIGAKKIKLAATPESYIFNGDTLMYEILLKVEQAFVPSGTSCTLSVEYKSESYRSLVPLYCIFKEGNNDFVFIINKRNGIFGEEYFVKKLLVKEKISNHLFMVLEEDVVDLKLVAYPSRALTDGDIVRVVK